MLHLRDSHSYMHTMWHTGTPRKQSSYSMYSEAYHSASINKVCNATRYTWAYTRFSSLSPVRYHPADFGLSVRIPPGAQCSSLVILGQTATHELSDTVPYDPFKVDNFVLGNDVRQHIHEKYFRVGFLQPLIAAMTHEDPQTRPTAPDGPAAVTADPATHLRLAPGVPAPRSRGVHHSDPRS